MQMFPKDMLSFDLLRESCDIEAKLALGEDGKGKLPGSLWETYSAMANTNGGFILLGVEEDADGHFIARHIKNARSVVKDFWNTINNREKISRNILSSEDVCILTLDGGKDIIRIRVPRAARVQKPIYCKTNPFTGTYLRNNEGDFRCPEERVKQMFAEQGDTPQDARLCEHYDLQDIDMESFHAYRQLCQNVRPDHVFNTCDDVGFLRQIGGWTRNRETGKEGLTVAGLLMFGKLRSILDIFPNYILDYQERLREVSEVRWVDRVTTDGNWAGNLFSFYRIVIKKLFADLKVPFSLKDSTTRVDDTLVHQAVREAFINALIHADYSGRCSVLVVKQPDRFSFRNPGTLRIPKIEVIRGGTSDCRNPNLQKMFQLAGLAERAGSGFPKIYRGWDSQSWIRPELDVRFEIQQIVLTLRMTSLLPKEAVAKATKELGQEFTSLPQLERLAVVTAYSEGCVSHDRMMEICTDHGADVSTALRLLVDRKLLEQSGHGPGTIYFPVGRKPVKGARNILANVVSSNVVSSNDASSNDASSNDTSSNDTSSNDASSNDTSSNDTSSNVTSSNVTSSNVTSSNVTSSNVTSKGLEIWSGLLRMAEPARKSVRIKQETMMALILQLCSTYYLSTDEFAKLLGRNALGLRNRYIIPMLNAGLLQCMYPTKTHPDQRYKATESSPDTL